MYSYYSNKDEIIEDRLAQARVFVLGGPREKFTAAEVTISFFFCHFYMMLIVILWSHRLITCRVRMQRDFWYRLIGKNFEQLIG